MRNLKTVGLAMLAVLALSAIAASAASAAEYHSESGSGTTYLTAVQDATSPNQVFKAGATVTCEEFHAIASYTGTTATSITAEELEYNKCKVAGQAATVKTEGCHFLFGKPTGTASPYGLEALEIKCPTGKTIVITATTSGCTIKVGSQKPNSTSTKLVDIAGSPMDVTGEGKLTEIESTSSGGVCGAAGTTKTASYTGNITVKAYSNAARTSQVGFTVF